MEHSPALGSFQAWYIAELERIEQDTGELWQEERQKHDELYELGREVLSNYVRWTLQGDQREWQVLAVEEPLKARIPGPKLSAHGYLEGTPDLLLRDLEGRLWIVDHKTSSQTPDLKALELDDQMTAYLWLVQQCWGETPVGAIHNIIRKSVPRRPKVLASGKLSRDMSIVTTVETYEREIRDQGLAIEDYNDVLAALRARGNVFLFRERILRNAHELREFQSRLYAEYQDIRRVHREPRLLYPNFTRDCSWDCSYYDLCKATFAGDDVEATIDSLYLREQSGRRDG